MFGRRVLPTTLDPVPRGLRAAPGCIAMNAEEIAALQANDGEVFKYFVALVHAEDHADALLAMRRPKKRKRKLGPSVRLSMVNAIYKGRQ